MASSTDSAERLTERQYAVLHGAALCQAVSVERIAETIGVAASEVDAEVERAVERGDLLRVRKSLLLSDQGQARLEREYAERHGDMREDPRVTDSMERFERANQQLLHATSEWQTIEVDGTRVRNDHADADYDAAVIGRIATIVERVERVLEPFAAREPRIARTCSRLLAAVERAEAGDPEYVSGLAVDSVHTVWFQLHEDLLRMMGRERDE